MSICPTCKGTGEQSVTAQIMQPDGTFKEEPPVQITCVFCDGKGEVTKDKLKFIEHYNSIWCKCGNPSGETDFYNDNEHDEIKKHHWRCQDCGKVVQIG